ncbi:MAG: enoyl-CoA hydratase/isomerase family protein [Rhizomicrobium sp.]
MMDDILFERRGAAGIITLNRPKVLNALNHGMIRSIREALDAWGDDDSIGAVILCGEGERAFCAGGDIRMFHASAVAGDRAAEDFWFDEYSLISYIHHYPKPHLALLHGITMGGGLGIAVPGTFRVGAENLVYAMPETGIGFFPDVGASYFLSRAPGLTGLYMAMSGARAKQADALYLGLITHVLPQKKWPDFIDALASGDEVGDLLRRARSAGLESAIEKQRGVIDAAFAAPNVEGVLSALDRNNTAFARETAAMIRSRSPLSVKVAFHAWHAGRTLDFDACMQMEYRVACRIKRLPDFREGIRATVIDKDNNPKWAAALGAVTDAEVEACFAPLPEGELAVSS